MSEQSLSNLSRNSGVYAVPTSQALDRSDRRKRFVQAVVASSQFGDSGRHAMAQFIADAITRRADGEFIARMPVEQFSGHVGHALQGLESRRNGDITVSCARPAKDSHGYELPVFVLETAMADQPFIIDTIKLVLKRLDVQVLGTLNMILPVERDGDGRLVAISQDNPRSKGESMSCHLLSASSVAGREQAITAAVAHALEQASRIASDFRMMRRLMRDILATLSFCAEGIPARAAEFHEESAFGEWLMDDNFVLMGVYGFDNAGRPTGRLGLGRYDKAETAGCESDPREAFHEAAPLVSILQGRTHAPIHRDAPLVEVRMRLFDGEGAPDGGVVFQGLFTYKAVTSRASLVPFLRHKLARMVAEEDLVPSSHRMKIFLSFFDRLPLPFSFSEPTERLRALINEAIDVDFGGSPRVWYRINGQGTSAQVFAILSHSRYSDSVRLQLRNQLTVAFGAKEALVRVLVGKTDTSLVDVLLFADEPLRRPDTDALSQTLTALVSPMTENLREQLRTAGLDEAGIDRLCLAYGSALPDDYPPWTESGDLAADLLTLEDVARSGQMQMRLRCDAHDTAAGEVRLLVYTPVDIALTDILPILDNFGLRVLGEKTWPVSDADGRTVYFETYRIAAAGDHGAALLGHGEAFVEGMQAVMDGRMNNTSINRLLLLARLTWRQVQVIRAYLAYARQLGVTFATQLVQQVLHNQPGLVATLLELFDARFNPQWGAVGGERQARVDAVDAKFKDQLKGVQDAVEDKVLRMFHNFVMATLRTNFWQRPDEARGLSFKMRCSAVEMMVEPRPMFEIWVYDPRVEGIHLRGGKVARGGLRWSDRIDDFRTEILGLMQTQMVKNTVIVPVGSKGGFVLKKPEKDDKARRKQADELYKVFISGLLDVTDNRIGQNIVPPEGVVVYDEPDPYLVVAADKGTAHLSDTANAISLARGFWLGDAFASGGSQGYDHKVYGITAKGGWVCVQREFREIGLNTQTDSFTAFGIGDMSGDVFGNGLLLTQTIQLLAAFDHRHIFLDPSPDALVSWHERKRLFDLPGSSWASYDAAKISHGGGVFPRTAKSIALTPEVRAMIGTDRDEMSGAELMHAILQMPVDLFWNGGIGTFVKASHESHAQAGDKTNDAIRVDASQLRCKVVGEGGNLGFTQAARVEFALRGGHIYTDAIDNSAGVDLSDHEVNLKIAFAPLLQDGRIDIATRNDLLFEIDQFVCELVLYNNYQQSQGLSLAGQGSAARIRQWGDVIKHLVDEMKVDQDVQMLPSKAVIAERKKQGLGLTRAELARITAFAKMWIFNHLSADRGSAKLVEREYLDYYFADAVRSRYPDAVAGHMLRHEIVTTLWTNAIVDYGSALLIPRLHMEYGRSVSELCQAWTFAGKALGLPQLRKALQALDYVVPTSVQYAAMARVEEAAAVATEWLLANLPGAALTTYLAKGDELAAWTGGQLTTIGQHAGKAQAEAVALAKSWQDQGMPAELATAVAGVSLRARLFAIWQVGVQTGLPFQRAASVYFATAEVTGLSALLAQVGEATPQSRWESIALASLGQGLGDTLAQLAVRVGSHPQGGDGRDGARKVLNDQLQLGAMWDLASQIAAEGVQVPALVVLSERLRTHLRQAN